ncbi:TIGR03086 family metal-binding protein [Catellatospora aurea]|uniref:TIGR03086 family metal-binding protein n=1 Tax=Catellatospora aurea TaxID=1337874 RepID=A0ABW2H749_9ACTN
MQLISLVTNSAEQTKSVIDGVSNTQLHLPTPCSEWDVSALSSHLLQVVSALRLAGLGQAVPDEHWATSQLTDEWAEQFAAEVRGAVEAWNTPQSWEGEVTMGSAQMPASFVATMLASDLVIHGWDLAKATGQPFRCDGETAEVAAQFVADTGAQGRDMGIYAEPVPVPEGAVALERVIALSGRDPNWRPSA